MACWILLRWAWRGRKQTPPRSLWSFTGWVGVDRIPPLGGLGVALFGELARFLLTGLARVAYARQMRSSGCTRSSSGGSNPNRVAVGRHRRHDVLGAARLGTDQHAQGR